MRRVLALIALVPIVAGCGGAPKPRPDPAAADRALAARLVLQRGDFPSGWRVGAAPPSGNPQSRATSRKTAACTGRPDPSTFVVAEVNGPPGSKDGLQVSSNATIIKTEREALADFVASTNARGIDCFKKVLIEPLAAGARKQHATLRSAISRLAVRRYGTRTAGIRLVLTLTQRGIRSVTYLDLVIMLKGRVELSGSFLATGNAFDPKTEAAFLAKLGGKLATV